MIGGMSTRMKAIFLTLALLAGNARADERDAPTIGWEALEIGRNAFSRDLGMLDPERDDYATNLTILAVNRINAAKASKASLTEGRRLLALAMHLSPRNRRAVVANFQLARNILPEKIDPNYGPEAFSRLLLARGRLLETQGGAENLRVARYFIHLAAVVDPKNDDAVYSSELMRLDGGAPDWDALTRPTAARAVPDGAEESDP